MAKKLERPLVIGGNEAYPLTTADQIIKADGSKLETADGISVAHAENADNAVNAVDANKLGGKSADYFASAESGIYTYAHTVGKLTGTGTNGKFKATVNETVSTLTVNGTACSVQCGEDAEMELIAGCWYTFILDGTTVNFKQGGAGLNFKIIGSTEQPASPKENTIWINTNTTIGKYQFSINEPTTRTNGSNLIAGDVWVRTTSYSEIELPISKNGIIKIPLQDVWLYDGSNWVWQETKIYQNSEWKDLYFLEYENSWHFVRTATINSQPKPADFVGTTIVAEGYYTDSSTSISMNMADSYSGKATTWLYFDKDITLSISYTTDDAGTVTINDTHIGNLASCAATTLSSPFKKGWNKLEICYTEGSGGDGWVTSPKLSTHVDVRKMYAKINNTL